MKQVNEHLFYTWRWFLWNLMDYTEKNLRSNIRRENLWNIFFFIFHVFFCLILYYPCFYSSLSNKKQRNGSIYKTNSILVYWYIKKNRFHGFSHFILLRGFFSRKSIKCHPKSVYVVKKWLGERLNFFSISSRLGHKPNYPLILVGVTFFKLAQPLRDVWCP